MFCCSTWPPLIIHRGCGHFDSFFILDFPSFIYWFILVKFSLVVACYNDILYYAYSNQTMSMRILNIFLILLSLVANLLLYYFNWDSFSADKSVTLFETLLLTAFTSYISNLLHAISSQLHGWISFLDAPFRHSESLIFIHKLNDTSIIA